MLLPEGRCQELKSSGPLPASPIFRELQRKMGEVPFRAVGVATTPLLT